jgi:cytochrome c-type biogenesis protein CcmF
MVKTYEVERDVKMAPGDTTQLANFVFTFGGVHEVHGPNYDGVQGTMEVTRGGRLVTLLKPEKRVYRVQQNPMTEAAISPGPMRDLYVSLGEPVEDAWIVRLYVKPFVDWIWAGCLLMAAGGALALSDRRYRARREARQGLGQEALA